MSFNLEFLYKKLNFADRRPYFFIAGAVFAGYIGWKLIQRFSQKQGLEDAKNEELLKKDNVVAVRNERKEHFMKLLRLSEYCLAVGKYDAGVDHLANVIVDCKNKEKLDEIIRSSLPKAIYEKLQKAVKNKLAQKSC